MVDSAALRQRRKRAHHQGDHTLCRPSGTCRLAGQVEQRAVLGLRAAIEAEFAGDPPRLEVGRGLVELAGGPGPTARGALRDLGQTIEAKRRGELAPAVAPTITDEVIELVDEVVDLEVAKRLTVLLGRRWLGPRGRPLPALIDELLGELAGRVAS